jgi:xanthine/uracil permease
MFPATVLVALLCGFHPNTVLLDAGVSTIAALILSRRAIGTFIPLFYGSPCAVPVGKAPLAPNVARRGVL